MDLENPDILDSTYVDRTLYFLPRDPLYEVEKPYAIQYEPHGDIPLTNVKQNTVSRVSVHDVRARMDTLSLETDGFTVCSIESKMRYEDFARPETVTDIYLTEIQNLLHDTLGTQNVAILEYLVRLL